MKHFYYSLIFLLISFNINSQTVDFLTGLNSPQDILLDDNILYIAESGMNRIIKVDLAESNPTLEVVIKIIYSPI